MGWLPSNVTEVLVAVGLSLSLAVGAVGLVVQVRDYCAKATNAYAARAMQEMR